MGSLNPKVKRSLYKKAREFGLSKTLLKSAVEMYREEFFRYPATFGDLLEVLE